MSIQEDTTHGRYDDNRLVHFNFVRTIHSDSQIQFISDFIALSFKLNRLIDDYNQMIAESQKAGISQDQLSEITGLNPSYCSAIANKRAHLDLRIVRPTRTIYTTTKKEPKNDTTKS